MTDNARDDEAAEQLRCGPYPDRICRSPKACRGAMTCFAWEEEQADNDDSDS